MPGSRILFEPWSLGDCLIAAAMLREDPAGARLACHPQWHPVLAAAAPGLFPGKLLPVQLAYTRREHSGSFNFDGARPGQGARRFGPGETAEVLNIRGDVRDYLAARMIFPGARIRMSGLVPFLARRTGVLDWPYSRGLLRVRNRYEAWARLAGIPFARIRARYVEDRSKTALKNGREAVVHVGAQWASRQYPRYPSLVSLLEDAGYRVTLVASAGDRCPPDVPEKGIARLQDGELVAVLKNASLAVTNDSGPMHLAAFLGVPTVVLARIANILEWLPPGVVYAASPRMPRGYRTDPGYMSDESLGGWPEPAAVVGMAEGKVQPGMPE